jgi:hypothetical protein
MAGGALTVTTTKEYESDEPPQAAAVKTASSTGSDPALVAFS